MSIKAHELRVGNWINGDREGDFQLNISNRIIVEANEHHHQPIPLTPEILELCGFSVDIWKDSGTPIGKWYSHDDILLTDDFKLDGVDMKPLQHLHQLQNLYWCLCGKELEINLHSLCK